MLEKLAVPSSPQVLRVKVGHVHLHILFLKSVCTFCEAQLLKQRKMKTDTLMTTLNDGSSIINKLLSD